MPRFRHVATAILLAGIAPLLLAACAGTEGLKAGLRKSITTPAPPASPIVEKVRVEADAAPPDPQPANLDYEVGVGDVLAVLVYGRIPSISSTSSSAPCACWAWAPSSLNIRRTAGRTGTFLRTPAEPGQT